MDTVTRSELVDHIEFAFATGAVTKADLLAAAAASNARPQVVVAVQQLPDQTFATVRDLWRHLADMPIGG
ncbi:DUF2795 domain-containing protein [Catellatospora chokoriensis]|uniref:DUF2795 domain-containing protein n=1 Tax=Catellatospora chokoriensis TaxID=310353 RepID=A0A8J3NWE3_9ACTN|nr:DUF2795 domain-containing protein [Catellatospora chokoriensis]GIF94826.1 hypothetical protein Cch02nite_82700 [Catellatospora chokoriensis]